MNLNEILKKQTSKRKLRLFSVACCDEILHLIKDSRSLQAVKIAELYADGLCTQQELRIAASDAAHVGEEVVDLEFVATYATYAAYAAASSAYEYGAPAFAPDAAANAAADAAASGAPYSYAGAYSAAKEKQLKIAEDIFGSTNLIIPQSPLILTIAKTIYEDKCWLDMSILADALEDNNCKNQEILNHLRSNQLHVRGCWTLDLILNKK